MLISRGHGSGCRTWTLIVILECIHILFSHSSSLTEHAFLQAGTSASRSSGSGPFHARSQSAHIEDQEGGNKHSNSISLPTKHMPPAQAFVTASRTEAKAEQACLYCRRGEDQNRDSIRLCQRLVLSDVVNEHNKTNDNAIY